MKFLKKSLVALLSLLLVFGISVPAFAEKASAEKASKNTTIDEIITSYNNPNGRVLCVAALGNPRLYPENSLEGIQSSISIGADIVTVSVQKTKDGKFVLMGDKSLRRMCVNKADGTAATTSVSDNTLEELQSEFYLREGRGGTDSKATKYTIPSLEQVINACKGKIMIMINNGWEYAEEINALARSLDACDIIIIRNAPTSQAAASFINKAGVPICHISTHYDKDSEGSAKAFVSDSLQIGAKMVELEAEKSYSNIFNKSVMNKFKDAGRAFISTTSPELCGGREDLIADWSDLIERGYSIIETDYPKELVNYIKEIESYRASLSSLITQAQGLNMTKYSKDSGNALSSSLEQAEKISSIGCVSLNQIDKARYDIQESLDGLVIRSEQESSSLSAWAIILIVIACIIVLLVLVVFGLRFFNKQKSKKKKLAKFKDKFKNEAPEANDHLTGISEEPAEMKEEPANTEGAEAETEADSSENNED